MQHDLVLARLQQGKIHLAQGWGRAMLWTAQGTVCALGALIQHRDPRYHEEMGAPDFRQAVDALVMTSQCRVHGLHDANTLLNQAMAAAHNNQCLRDQVDALDWFERAIRWVKEQA